MSVQCPHCRSIETVKNGTQNGKQRYRCKKCKRTFQEYVERIKRTYNIERFLCTLYKLIDDEKNIANFSDEEIIDEITHYLEKRPYNNIVIKNIENTRDNNEMVVNSYDLKLVIIFKTANEVQLHKFNAKNKKGEYKITIKNETKYYYNVSTI